MLNVTGASFEGAFSFDAIEDEWRTAGSDV
jgi:hypothetical protein